MRLFAIKNLLIKCLLINKIDDFDFFHSFFSKIEYSYICNLKGEIKMKKLTVLLIALTMFACTKKKQEEVEVAVVEPVVTQESLTSKLYTLSEKGIDKEIGTITVIDLGEAGIAIEVVATNIAPGEHGFHLHEKSTLTPTTNKEGKVVIAGGAGGHWDPEKTGKHLGPEGNGHKGDLPKLTVAKDGTVKAKVISSKIFIKDIPGKSFMVHVHGDNYLDKPATLGGGGARLYAAPF